MSNNNNDEKTIRKRKKDLLLWEQPGQTLNRRVEIDWNSRLTVEVGVTVLDVNWAPLLPFSRITKSLRLERSDNTSWRLENRWRKFGEAASETLHKHHHEKRQFPKRRKPCEWWHSVTLDFFFEWPNSTRAKKRPRPFFLSGVFQLVVVGGKKKSILSLRTISFHTNPNHRHKLRIRKERGGCIFFWSPVVFYYGQKNKRWKQ